MTATGFVLRAFAREDLSAIADFWVEAWTATGLAIDFEARRVWLCEHLTALARDAVDIVVGVDARGAPAGFVTIDRGSGHLDQLCVATAARGSELARALLNEAKRRAPGVIELDVNADNPRACRFYLREGFEVAALGVSALSGLPTLHLRWTSRDAGGNVANATTAPPPTPSAPPPA